MNEEQSLLITYELDGLLVLLSPIVAAFIISAIAGFGTVFGAQSRTPRKLAGARVRRAERNLFEIRTQQALNTLIRIGIPTVSAAVLGLLYFDNLSLYLSSNLSPQTLAILSRDNLSGQYVQNFLVVIDLLFAILAGSAFAELYQQQESIYNALYKEVSIAQILLEQLTLVGQARPWYPKALGHMSDYLENDLRQLQVSPVEQLSANPSVDPLESIMRLTSVGELAWKRRLLPRARLAPPLHLLRLRTTLFSPTFHPCPSVRPVSAQVCPRSCTRVSRTCVRRVVSGSVPSNASSRRSASRCSTCSPQLSSSPSRSSERERRRSPRFPSSRRRSASSVSRRGSEIRSQPRVSQT